ncbi:hypothetical protein E4U21_004263 [Claviceps maximensis]|nr:hypothetical protein E4U21_004263 [Claviceps maximensis]
MARLSALLALAATGATAMRVPAQEPLDLHAAPALPVLKSSAGTDRYTASALPLINTEALQKTIKAENLLARAEKLYEFAKESVDAYGHATRVIGSKGHLATIDYVKSELTALGDYYNVAEQTLSAVLGTIRESNLTIASRASDTAFPMGLTPPTADKKPVSGQLKLVANSGCNQSDYASAVAGNIALIKRGECAFDIKSLMAGQAGAVAAVIYNNVADAYNGSLVVPNDHHVPTFSMSGTEGDGYVEQLSRGRDISASAYIDSSVDTIQTTNIIAQTVGGDADNCVMLGGHSDSVIDGPGINDDGSGSLSVLEVAVQTARFRTKNCVRFAWWAAEEEGLVGSDHYVKSLLPQQNQQIRLFMDYDMMASPNFAYQVYNATDDTSPPGSQALRDLYTSWYEAQGLNYTLVPFDGRSDYDGFIKGGIPSGGIATGAEKLKTEQEVAMFGGVAGVAYDKNYHAIGDDLQNLNMTAWEVNTKLIAHSVATFAASLDGFPPRKPLKGTQSVHASKFHGKALVM